MTAPPVAVVVESCSQHGSRPVLPANDCCAPAVVHAEQQTCNRTTATHKNGMCTTCKAPCSNAVIYSYVRTGKLGTAKRL